MHRVVMDNHIGTHIEVPYHVIEDGDDLAEVPLESLCGEALILDLVGAEPGEYMPLSKIQEARESRRDPGRRHRVLPLRLRQVVRR